MRIEALETLRHEAHPNLIHVRLRAEDGTLGLGETFFEADAVEQELHERHAPELIGAPAPHEPPAPPPAESLRSPAWSARSALDLALHDLHGKLAGLPLCELLGGPLRDSAPVYVTCIDAEHPGEDWGLGVPGGSGYQDWTNALERPVELARELTANGFRGAKLFPFVRLEAATGGRFIEADMLAEQVEPFRAMREAAGEDFSLFCDLAGGWSLEPALEIARALEPLGLSWLEDPVPPGRLDDLRTLATATSVPLAGHETRAGLESFRELIETGALAFVHLDIQWCGGVAEARRVAAVAAARGLPVAFHDCAGPVAWAGSVHAALALPNASWLECARPYALDAYPAIADGAPRLDEGRALATAGPGHGVSLTEAYLARASARISS